MWSKRDPPRNKGHKQTESERLEKDISCKWRPKIKTGVAILISDKIDFKVKAVKRDKEGHYIMIKGSIQNKYALNTGAPQNVRQMLTSMKGEINNNTIIVGDLNIPLIPMNR